MAQIVIDAREWSSSTGRYISNLVRQLEKLKTDHTYAVLMKPEDLASWESANPNFKKLACPYKEFSFGEQLGFKTQLDGLGADLVHFGMSQQPVRYRGRAVTTVHDLTTLRFTNPSKNLLVFKIKQRVYRYVVRRAAKRSLALITPSDFVKKDLANFSGVNPDKITVTYEAADKIEAVAEPLQGLVGIRFIMYVGRPMPHKNLERLIEAFQNLQADHPDLKLVLAGKKDDNTRLIEKVVGKRAIKNVVFTDFVSESQLRWLYENCAAYVFPSLSEGFGLPGLEAMLHGAPVVSSNATCLPEIYGEAAHYFNPFDVKAISQAIGQVLNDEKLRKELTEKGRGQAAKYSWQRMAEQTLAIYDQVLRS